MPKRKSSAAEEAGAAPPRRSTRSKTTAAAAPDAAAVPAREKASTAKKSTKKVEKTETPLGKPAASKQKGKAAPKAASGAAESKPAKTAKAQAKAKTETQAEVKTEALGPSAGSEKQYWLMKAEPGSRIENGVDVKFSIDDLAAKTEPEPWDGIRAFQGMILGPLIRESRPWRYLVVLYGHALTTLARNNLRAMKKGDLAFFYHSNCKEPAIVGTMEIVKEHSPDLSAHDPKAPYYDPSSKPSDPKWSVVHVRFRSKFDEPIMLKELREMGVAGKPLENMQMLRISRLSVSKVGAAEWNYLMEVAEQRGSK